MNDQEFLKFRDLRATGMSWAQIAADDKRSARALGKAFSVARLARGGAPLRKDKPNRSRNTKPAKPAQIKGDLFHENSNPDDHVVETLAKAINEVSEQKRRLEKALSIVEGS